MKNMRTSISSFKRIREGNGLYIDKTEYVHRMVSDPEGGSFYFISRPRRFGKSLMCSTLECLFKGERELFKGLYIDSTGYDYKKYPVLRFDFSKLPCTSFQAFKDSLLRILKDSAKDVSIEAEADEPSEMLDKIIEGLQTDVVVIIDEFDSPIVSTLNNRELAEGMRSVFNAFYKVIKANSEKIRFLFITGVTKLSHMSIFSAMNNLVDITFDRRYAGMFGYTDGEILESFGENIDSYVSRSDAEYHDRSALMDALRSYYDGYCFSPDSDLRLYNPISVNYFFYKGCEFGTYWQNTGVSTLAVELAKRYDLIKIVDEMPRLSLLAVSSFDIGFLADGTLSRDNVLSLLLLSGYLTIDGSDQSSIYLSFPNYEIKSSFLESLLGYYANKDSQVELTCYDGKSAAMAGDTESLVEHLNEYYSKFSYIDLGRDKERFVTTLFKAYFVATGASVLTEAHLQKGRADVVLDLRDEIYIIEFKTEESAQKALEQIKERRYYLPYKTEGSRKRIHLLGLRFSLEDAKVVEYQEEIV